MTATLTFDLISRYAVVSGTAKPTVLVAEKLGSAGMHFSMDTPFANRAFSSRCKAVLLKWYLKHAFGY